jgi:hypothetical protein
MLGIHDDLTAFWVDEALFVRLRLAQEEEVPDEEGARFGAPPPAPLLKLLPTAEG